MVINDHAPVQDFGSTTALHQDVFVLPISPFDSTKRLHLAIFFLQATAKDCGIV
jgi:hypothetical protein